MEETMIRTGRSNNVTEEMEKKGTTTTAKPVAAATTAVMVQEGMHDGILMKIFDYVEKLGEQSHTKKALIIPGRTQDDIMNLTRVSKRFHRIISANWDIIPVFVLKPQPQDCYGSTRKVFVNLCDYLSRDETNKKLQTYNLMRLIHVDKFIGDIDDCDAQGIIANIRLNGITSLEIISSLTLDDDTAESATSNSNDTMNGWCLVDGLLRMLPNLLDINLSKTNGRYFAWVFYLRVGQYLETITWNHMHYTCDFRLDGHQIKAFPPHHCNNLKQLCMDDSTFTWNDNGDGQKFTDFEEREEEEDNRMNTNNNNNDNPIFIFHECCDNIERLSIRNATYIDQDIDDKDNTKQAIILHPISQNALIKFVRNAPKTLRWFRSDLSPENMCLLQTERPHIELMN